MTEHGWPANRSDVPPCLLPYFDIRDELVVQGMIVFKGYQLVVTAARNLVLSNELIKVKLPQ